LDKGLLPNKKNSSILAKKSNIGIKINAKPLQTKTLASESTVSDKETVSQSDNINNSSTSISNTTGTKLNIGNSLSLLGTYSGSSDDDSS
jgi:hypothetical protein